MNLIQFKRNPDGTTFHIKMDDGFEADISSQKLRDNCPCAGCKGEEVLLHKYVPLHQKPATVESYMLDKAEIKGNYGIQLSWKDGHDTGIYNWDYLKLLADKS